MVRYLRSGELLCANTGLHLASLYRYHSPYPLPIEEEDASSSASAGPGRLNGNVSASRGHASKRGNARGRARGHDVNAPVEESMLWVCDRCFKYMRDGTLHDLHSVSCFMT